MSDDRDRGDPGDRVDREELDERVAELEARVRELRAELGRPPEGPLGLPRPPTPREMLSFTGEYAIPTAIAVLEANVRALKALQQVVRVLDPERNVVGEERDRLETRAADASRATLDRLESALEDVETTIRESDFPREDEARNVLEDARRINREIRDRVERERRRGDEARERARETDRERPNSERPSPEQSGRERSDSDDTDLEGGTTIELTDEGDEGEDEMNSQQVDDEGEDDSDDGPVEVDVEAELRSIKDEIEGPEGDESADGKSAGDDSSAANSPGTETSDTDGPDTDSSDGGTDDSETDDEE